MVICTKGFLSPVREGLFGISNLTRGDLILEEKHFPKEEVEKQNMGKTGGEKLTGLEDRFGKKRVDEEKKKYATRYLLRSLRLKS